MDAQTLGDAGITDGTIVSVKGGVSMESTEGKAEERFKELTIPSLFFDAVQTALNGMGLMGMALK